ncbi:PIN domain-containing protein [Egbenema bharatensis]|uniref:PIN domain-containing protein n=1 Tax=Egbenema bharatensis TaxID=3463334 RepID=UPI003A865444
MLTHTQLLHRDLEKIVELTDKLIEISDINYAPDKVERLSRETSVAIMTIVPDSSWAALSDEGRCYQRKVLDQWNRWLEKVRLLFTEDSGRSRQDLEDAAEKVTKWLDRSEPDFSIPKNLADAPFVFREHIQPLFDLLAPFMSDGSLVVVPDTNVILRNQELPSWAEVLGTDEFVVLLVPGVLSELDDHKINHRVPEVREKARTFSNRIKGWRNQGELSDGVRVQGKVYVRVSAREPNFQRTLSWLDPQVADDRIIASVLEWQRSNPTNAVQLLCCDSIMLAKADEAGVPTGDVPDRKTD